MKRECTCPRAKHVHGTVGAYLRDGCRCFPCRVAKHYAAASYRAGESWSEHDGMWVPKIGTTRRLEALMRVGHTARIIGDRAGLTEHHVQNLRNGRNPTVTAEIALAVARAYDDLWDTPAVGPMANRLRTNAERLGYAPPMAWDDDTIDNPDALPYVKDPRRTRISADEVAISEAMAGRSIRLNRYELSAAIARLTAAGHSAREIAERLGTTHRNVTRTRTREEAA